jgi:hypothetical protein
MEEFRGYFVSIVDYVPSTLIVPCYILFFVGCSTDFLEEGDTLLTNNIYSVVFRVYFSSILC